jgi:hypothetical protein
MNDVAFALLDATRRMSISKPRTGITRGSTEDTNSHMSSSVGSGSTASSGWFDSWKSVNELDDKTGSLPKEAGSWFNAPSRSSSSQGEGYLIIPDIFVDTVHGSRHRLQRAFSESEGTGRVKLGLAGSWLGQGGNRSAFSPSKFNDFETIIEPAGGSSGRIRRSSSKDVEDSLSCGLNKAEIYMPPF